jgi:GWxTD domain-containing protein
MRTPGSVLLFTGILFFITACAPVKVTYDPNDLSYIYNPLRNSFNPVFRVFNESPEKSELAIKFYTNDLFFSEANTEGVSKTSMALAYRLFNMSSGRVAIDTAMFNLVIREETGRREYTYTVPLNAPLGYSYEIEVIIRDLIRGTQIQRYIQFDKRDNLNRNNFKIFGHFDHKEVYTPILRDNEFVNISYKEPSVDSLYVKYFEPFLDVPAPPYLLIPERELDMETFRVTTIPLSDTLPIMCPNEGVYNFSASENTLTGYTIFNFGEDFPSMRTPLKMIEPLTYLVGDDDLQDMLNHPRPKVALDEFWVERTGNIEQARELIRIYYNRVLYSNLYFTSYKEGWRSDRGMIYVIYGPPDKVYKSMDGERWGYNRPQIKSGWGIRYKVEAELLFFSFRKRENTFTDNDYSLVRSESLTTFWEQAVRSWQEGVVFKLDNPGGI